MRRAITVVFAGALMFTAACANDYGRDDAVDDLTSGGLSDEAATCVVDEIEARDIGYGEANESDRDGELFQEIVDIAVDCMTEAETSDTPDEPAADDETEGEGTDD